MTNRFPQLASINDCTGCMACVDSCNKNAINNYRGEDGHLYVRVNDVLCIGCLKCEKVCKGRANYKGNNEIKESQPFAAWAINKELRSKSTSGGVFAAIATRIIEQGGVVIGAYFDGRNARHIAVDRVDELCKLQGSKYVQSNTEGIFNIISKYLPERKVLFSGVGCQAAAVLSFFANNPNKNSLYTLDLICGGVPSDLLMEKYFKMKIGLDAITSFRTKRRYELKGVVDGREKALGRGTLPLSGFAAEQTNRLSCYHCQYAYGHRKCDITIGDLWGNVGFEQEMEKGISLVVVHNDRGLDMLKTAEIEKYPIQWHDFLQHNARLVIGDMPLTYLRKNLTKNVKKMSNKLFAEAYTSKASIKHPILFIDRCIRAFKKRLFKYQNKRRILNILSK